MNLLLAVSVLLTDQARGWIEIQEPTPPWRVTHELRANCGGRNVVFRYAVDSPGPDLFSAIEVDGTALARDRIGNLNDMIAGYFLDEVTILGCGGEGDQFEVRFRLRLSRAPETWLCFMSLKHGFVRAVNRDGSRIELGQSREGEPRRRQVCEAVS